MNELEKLKTLLGNQIKINEILRLGHEEISKCTEDTHPYGGIESTHEAKISIRVLEQINNMKPEYY